MKKFNLNLRLAAVVMFFALGAASCSKENTGSDLPVIAETGMPADTLMKAGKSITFTPSVSEGPELFSWSVNGTEKSAEKDFTFTPEAPGSYTLVFKAANSAGTADKTIRVGVRKYYGGFYIVNEGNYGHTDGSIYYYDEEEAVAANRMHEKIFVGNNTGKNLIGTVQFATIWGNNFYIVSKGLNDASFVPYDSKMTVVDVNTFKFKAEIPVPAGTQALAFQGIDANTGILGTTGGAFKVDLNSFTLGNEALEGSAAAGACGDMITTGNHLLMFTSSNGALVYSIAENFKLINDLSIPEVTTGFARMKNGTIWAGTKTDNAGTPVYGLVGLNPNTLAQTRVPLPDGVALYGTGFYWKPNILQAATATDALYIQKYTEGQWGAVAGNETYRYEDGNIASLNRPFFTSPSVAEGYTFYGAPAVNPKNGNIYSIMGTAYGAIAKIEINDASGAFKTTIPLDEQNLFPSMIVFD